MSLLTVAAAIGIIAFVIGQQVIGTALRGKRVVVLPLVLIVIGIAEMHGSKGHVTTVTSPC